MILGLRAVLAVAFALAAVVGADLMLLAVPLYTPVYGPPSHINIPSIPISTLVAGLLLGVGAAALRGSRPTAHDAARGVIVGAGASIAAALVRAAAIPFHDPDFATVYRLYGLLMEAVLLTAATSSLWRIGTRRAAIVDPWLLAWPMLATVAAAGVAALVQQDLAPGAVALLALAAGWAVARLSVHRIARVGVPQTLAIIAAIAFALRAAFGLQALARIGSGAGFAAASDDGPSYFEKAVALNATLANAGAVLSASDGFPPAYSFFLAAWLAIGGGSLTLALLAQALLASAAVVLLYLLARRFTSPASGLLAAALYATELNLVQNNSTLTTEAILLPTLLFACWTLERYRRSGSVRDLLVSGLAIGLVFATRNNVGGILLGASCVWIALLARKEPLRAARDITVLVALMVACSIPVAVATAQLDGRPRLTNQLAAVAYTIGGNDNITIENKFLIERGIDPFRDPLGSIQRVISDPLPVIGFFATAVPQRMSALLFFAPSGNADPAWIVTPQYPNRYGQLMQLLLVAGLIVTTFRVLDHRPWRRAPLVGLLLLYTAGYLALFGFVFPPDHPFRYRIPVEPVMFLAQGAGLVVLARLVRQLWTPSTDESVRAPALP